MSVRPFRPGPALAAAAWLAAASLAAACAPAGDAPDLAGDTPDVAGEGSDSLPHGDFVSVSPLPGEGPPREYRLLLVNALDVETRVFASAGAASVVLETHPSQDSARVTIRVRADMVRLEAREEDGTLLGEIDLVLAPDTLNRWLIEAGASLRGVTRGATRSLINWKALYCGSDLCPDPVLAALGEGTTEEGNAMKKLRIALALVASVAMIVVGQRQMSQKDVRTQKAAVQGLDSENEALFI